MHPMFIFAPPLSYIHLSLLVALYVYYMHPSLYPILNTSSLLLPPAI